MSKLRFQHLHFKILDSTHLWCKQQKQWIEEQLHDLDFCLVSTDEQTQGVGRLAASWKSAAGSVAFNLALLDPLSDPGSQQLHGAASLRLAELSCAAAWAVCEALGQLQLPCYLKWPNDLITQRGKIAGCLIERYSAPACPWISVGVGINVLPPPERDGIDQPIDWLAHYGIEPLVKEWSQVLAAGIFEQLARLKEQRFDFGHLLNNPYTGKGCWVSAQTAQGPVEGRVLDLDRFGRLHLELGDATIAVFDSGQCWRLRARN